jgi:hypothetical protein
MMLHLSPILAALALAVSSVEAGCYGFSTAWSDWYDRSEERNHVTNMCRGYTNNNGDQRGALQDVRTNVLLDVLF